MRDTRRLRDVAHFDQDGHIVIERRRILWMLRADRILERRQDGRIRPLRFGIIAASIVDRSQVTYIGSEIKWSRARRTFRDHHCREMESLGLVKSVQSLIGQAKFVEGRAQSFAPQLLFNRQGLLQQLGCFFVVPTISQ